MNFKKQIFLMARQDVKTLVFPEANFSDNIMKAVATITLKELAKVILIGDQAALFRKYSSLESSYLKIVNPATSELKDEVAKKIFDVKKKDGITEEEAKTLALDPYYFASALLILDYADAMVSGTESTDLKNYQVALEIVGPKKQNQVISSAMIFSGKNLAIHNRPILISDCSFMENPNEYELVQNSKKCVELWKTLFFEEPKIAFLSHSTNKSARTETTQKMRVATKRFLKECPDVLSEGEVQLDVALSVKAQHKKFPQSRVRGGANILIVPNIDVGSCLAKAFGLIGGLSGIGAIGLGFKKPVSVLSRFASVEEIILTSAITAIQAQVD